MTTRPGARLRALAARLCTTGAMERFVDPAIADLQHEHESAVRQGDRWRARAIRWAGTARLLQVLCIVTARERAYGRARVLFLPIRSIPAVVAGTVAWAVVSGIAIVVMVGNVPIRPAVHFPLLSFYLAPAAWAVSVPCGFALGVLIAVGRSTGARRRAASLLATASLLSILSFGVLSVLTPTTNQLFRAAAFGQTAARGINELTLSELRRLADAPRDAAGFVRHDRAQWADLLEPIDAREVLFAYYTRIAVALAPLLLCAFALALSNRSRVARTAGLLFVWTVYLFWFTWLRDPLLTFWAVSPSVLAWAPDIVVLVPTLWLGASKLREPLFAPSKS